MAEALTTLEEADGAAVLTLNRPDKRNALSRALREEIVQRLDALEESKSVRSVVLTGAPPAFCAGFDRSELTGGGMEDVFAESTAYHRRRIGSISRVFATRLSKDVMTSPRGCPAAGPQHRTLNRCGWGAGCPLREHLRCPVNHEQGDQQCQSCNRRHSSRNGEPPCLCALERPEPPR